MKATLNRTGEKHITNEGYEIEIIEYLNYNNCTIKFIDGHIVEKVCNSFIKNNDKLTQIMTLA